MALTNSDLSKIGNLISDRDERLMKNIGKLMDEKMLDFHEKVTEPMINNVVESLHENINKMESRLNGRMDNFEGKMNDFEGKMNDFENNQYRIEKKLDNVSDHHSDKIDDHEKRIVRLEGRSIASL